MLFFFHQVLQLPALIHAIIIPFLMNTGETYKQTITILQVMTVLLNGEAGIGCIWEDSALKCLSGVWVLHNVVVKLDCLSMVLIQDFRMEWWPVKWWELMIGCGCGRLPLVAATSPTPFESKLVLEIITSMNLSNPTHQSPGQCTVQVNFKSQYEDKMLYVLGRFTSLNNQNQCCAVNL